MMRKKILLSGLLLSAEGLQKMEFYSFCSGDKMHVVIRVYGRMVNIV
jgi:hypothetical protein